MLLVGAIAMCGLADEAMAAPCRPSISFASVGLAVDRNFNACDVYFPDIPPTWGGLYRLHGTRLDNQAPIGVVDGTSYTPKPDDLVDTVNARYGFTFDASTGTYTIRLLSVRNEAATSDSIVLYSYDRNGAPYGGEAAIATQPNTISVTLPNAFPAVGSVSPTTASPLGGTSVIITGTGFAEATSVKFGGAAATSFTIDSPNQITAVAPAGAVGPADIVVATAIGSTTFSGGFNYVVSAPGAPTIGAVTTLDPDGAQVNFTPPVNNGGGAITEYVVTSSPHGKTGVGSQSPIAVRGLWSGVSYTFTVTARNAAGVGPSSSASQAVVPRNFQTIDFSPGPQTFGTTPVLSAMNTSGLPVVFSSTTPAVCTVTPAGELTFHSAGTCTINADAEGNAAYFPAQTITRSFAVNPALPEAPTIDAVTTLDPDGAQVNFTPPVNNGGGAITEYVVTSSPHGKTGVGTQSPISVHGLWSGMSYTFTVTAKNAAGVGPSSSASQAVVPRNFQTIDFSPGPQTFGTTPVLSAMNTSGLPVVFSSTTPAVCTVTPPGQLTFHSAGTCTINADAAGNAAYFPAQTITRSFAVNPALPDAPTIGAVTTLDPDGAQVNFTPPVNNGGGAITEYVVTSSPHGKTGVGTQSPISVTGLSSGMPYTFTVTAKNAAGVGPSSSPSQAVVPRNFQTIDFNPGPQTFGTTPLLSAMNTSGLPVVFSSATPGVCAVTPPGELTFHSAGTCTINADAGGNAAYFPAQTVTRSFAVHPVVPSVPTIGAATAGDRRAEVTFAAQIPADGAPVVYTVTANPGGATGTGSQSPVTVTGLTNGVDYTFSVTATNAAGTSAASATSNSVTPAAAQTISFDNPGTQTFGTTPVLTATSDSGLSPTFTSGTQHVCSITSDGKLTFVAAGTCTINALQAGSPAHLPAAEVSQSFTVIPVVPGAPLIGSVTAGDTQATITFAAPASNGGATIVDYTVTANPGGASFTAAVSPIIATALTNGTAYTFTVTANNAAGAGATSATSNAVTPVAAQLITFANPGSQTVGTVSTLTATSSSGLPPVFTSLTPAICTITGSATLTAVAIGPCTISADQPGNAAYLPAPTVTHSFAINPQLPIVGSVSATVAANSAASPVALSLSGGAADRVEIASAPAHGSATVSGMSIDYTPDPGFSGADSFTYTATNAAGTSAPATVAVTVSPPIFAFTPATGALDGGAVGRAYSQAIGVANGAAPYRFAVVAGTLPIGLHLDPSSGAITGTPTAEGSGGFTILATDANGATGTVSYQIAIGQPLPVVGNVVVAVTASSAANPIPLSLSGGLAQSVSVAASPSHGTASVSGTSISYTPEPGYAGADSFTYTATNATGTSAPATVSITVVASKLTFLPSGGDLPDAMVGEGYSAMVTAKGGQGGILYSQVRGELPKGVILNVSTGELSGPLHADVEAKTYGFTIAARDAVGNTGEASYRLTVKGRGVTVVSRSYTVVEGDSPRNVYLNAGATGGPFTGAGVAFVNPSSAGKAEIIEGELAASGAFAPVGYYLRFTPNPGFIGTAVVGYRLESALGLSNTGTITYAIVHNSEKVAAEIDGLVRDFVRARQNLLSTTVKVPGLIERRRMGRAGGDPVSTSMSPAADGMTVGFSTSLAQLTSADEVGGEGGGAATLSPFNIWIDGTVAVHKRDENAGRWGTFGLLSAGADYLLSEKVLVGLSFHLDRMTDPTDADAELTGNGWLAGPYASFELGTGVFLDTSLLYGGSWNDIDTKYFDGSFDTRRIMWDTKLQGQWQLGDATVLTPALRAVFLNEKVEDYSVSSGDGTKVDLKGFTEEQLRLSVGADLERAYRLDNGLVLTPRVGGTAGFAALDNNGAFGTVSAGLNLSNDLNWDFDFSLLYGIESDGEQTIGAKAGAHVRF
ncbi:hypothetical protein OKW20_005900 [Ensifer sp. LBL]